jgi:hypothetical protein
MKKQKLELYADKAIVRVHAIPVEIKDPFDSELIVEVEVDPDAVVADLIQNCDADRVLERMDENSLQELREAMMERFGLVAKLPETA